MAGTSDDIPDYFAGRPVYLAKARDSSFHRYDVGLANFLYRKDRVWKKQL